MSATSPLTCFGVSSEPSSVSSGLDGTTLLGTAYAVEVLLMPSRVESTLTNYWSPASIKTARQYLDSGRAALVQIQVTRSFPGCYLSILRATLSEAHFSALKLGGECLILFAGLLPTCLDWEGAKWSYLACQGGIPESLVMGLPASMGLCELPVFCRCA